MPNLERYSLKGIVLQGELVTYPQLLDSFAKTADGKNLANITRFVERWKPATVNGQPYPNKEWQKLIGIDANDLYHHLTSAVLTRSFLEAARNPLPNWPGQIGSQVNQFTHDEERLLMLTATLHDWPEIKTGDIAQETKLTTGAKDDDRALMAIVAENFPELQYTELKAMIPMVIDVLQGTNPKLRAAFTAIENVGYVRTALVAWKKTEVYKDFLALELTNALRAYVTADFALDLPRLVDSATLYPGVHQFLNQRGAQITRIFAAINSERFTQPANEADQIPAAFEYRQKIHNRFASAKEKWQQFSNLAI